MKIPRSRREKNSWTARKNDEKMSAYEYAKNNIMLAPLAGYTDKAFRKLCAMHGAGLTFTEMVSAKGLQYHNARTFELIDVSPEEGHAGIQLFGKDPQIVSQTAQALEAQYANQIALFDVNMGCPAPKIVNNGEGSALMKTPELAAAIIKELKKRVALPVTVKMRIGFDEASINAVDFALRLEQSGVDAVTVHGRTRQQYYSGKANRKVIAEVKRALRIPVIANGDIFTPEDARAMLEETGCDGVMIARGAMGNPFIFEMTLQYLQTGSYETPTTTQRVEAAVFHAQMACQEKGEYVAIREMRKHACAYIKGLKGAARLREQLVRAETLAQFTEIIGTAKDCK